jgi:hypothetical protein
MADWKERPISDHLFVSTDPRAAEGTYYGTKYRIEASEDGKSLKGFSNGYTWRAGKPVDGPVRYTITVSGTQMELGLMVGSIPHNDSPQRIKFCPNAWGITLTSPDSKNCREVLCAGDRVEGAREGGPAGLSRDDALTITFEVREIEPRHYAVVVVYEDGSEYELPGRLPPGIPQTALLCSSGAFDFAIKLERVETMEAALPLVPLAGWIDRPVGNHLFIPTSGKVLNSVNFFGFNECSSETIDGGRCITGVCAAVHD